MSRDFSTGWCPEDVPLLEAFGAITPERHAQREAQFAAAKSEEQRAAAILEALTGLAPQLEDTDGRQRAVDITLYGEDGAVEIAEVTSSIDPIFQRDRSLLLLLVDEVNRAYGGPTAWSLGFEFGWEIPPRSQHGALAAVLCAELDRLDAAGGDSAPAGIGPEVLAYRGAGQGSGGVSIAGWSTNTPSSGDEPYLDRLTEYLHVSGVIAKKLTKLDDEGRRLGAARRHLYVHMSSTGSVGGLLPVSPSYFTWGDFSCPQPVTDLWLDGRAGEVYHWSDPVGWRFHRA